MAFAIEWDSPIFYLNLAAFLIAAYILPKVWRQRDTVGGGRAWFWMVLLIGTGLHVIGDLFEFPEANDHILIHAVVLLAILGPAVNLRKV